MSEDRLSIYLKHIDHYGSELVEDTALKDKRLTDEEKKAVQAYLNVQKYSKRTKKK